MRWAAAVWNYEEPGVALEDLLDEFAGFGCDTVALSSEQLGTMDQARTAVHLRRRGLPATLHCTFETPADKVCRFAGLLGDLLLACTWDPIRVTDSRGTRYDVSEMVPLLQRVLAATGNARIGIEDFPLDREALDFYRRDLEPLLASPRFGMLVDIGHLNLRLAEWPSLRGVSAGEYLRRLPLPVWEVHLHDNRGKHDEHGHFGMGTVDFPAVAEGLHAIRFEGVSTIEIAPSFHGSTPRESKPHLVESLVRWKEIWRG
jgi:sugar phosphate isomerase/epimerase